MSRRQDRETDPRSRDYSLGFYNRQFNETDWIIRKTLDLYAAEFFPEDSVPTVLRRLANEGGPYKGLMVVPASMVLDESEKDQARHKGSVLYLPIERLTGTPR